MQLELLISIWSLDLYPSLQSVNCEALDTVGSAPEMMIGGYDRWLAY